MVNQKSVAVSYVLWFFLGMLGIHKSYLRQPIQGAIYLVLAVLGWIGKLNHQTLAAGTFTR